MPGRTEMPRLVHLFELDSVRNADADVIKGQLALLSEILSKGNCVVLTLNQLCDSRTVVEFIREHRKTFELFVAEGAIRYLKYKDTTPVLYLYTRLIDSLNPKGGFIFSAFNLEEGDKKYLRERLLRLADSDATSDRLVPPSKFEELAESKFEELAERVKNINKENSRFWQENAYRFFTQTLLLKEGASEDFELSEGLKQLWNYYQVIALLKIEAVEQNVEQNKGSNNFECYFSKIRGILKDYPDKFRKITFVPRGNCVEEVLKDIDKVIDEVEGAIKKEGKKLDSRSSWENKELWSNQPEYIKRFAFVLIDLAYHYTIEDSIKDVQKHYTTEDYSFNEDVVQRVIQTYVPKQTEAYPWSSSVAPYEGGKDSSNQTESTIEKCIEFIREELRKFRFKQYNWALQDETLILSTEIYPEIKKESLNSSRMGTLGQRISKVFSSSSKRKNSKTTNPKEKQKDFQREQNNNWKIWRRQTASVLDKRTELLTFYLFLFVAMTFACRLFSGTLKGDYFGFMQVGLENLLKFLPIYWHNPTILSYFLYLSFSCAVCETIILFKKWCKKVANHSNSRNSCFICVQLVATATCVYLYCNSVESGSNQFCFFFTLAWLIWFITHPKLVKKLLKIGLLIAFVVGFLLPAVLPTIKYDVFQWILLEYKELLKYMTIISTLATIAVLLGNIFLEERWIMIFDPIIQRLKYASLIEAKKYRRLLSILDNKSYPNKRFSCRLTRFLEKVFWRYSLRPIYLLFLA